MPANTAYYENPEKIGIILSKETQILEDVIDNTKYCSCVKSARSEGVKIPMGTDADMLVPNSIPIINSLIIFKYSNDVYHVAVIKEITEDGYRIVEGNKTKCKKEERTIPFDYPFIRGFWSTEQTITDFIKKSSIENGVNQELALNIACAESCTRNESDEVIINPSARNPNSSASGVYQFINGSWDYYCEGNVLNPKDNITCAIKLLAKGEVHHWEESRLSGFGDGWHNNLSNQYDITN